MQLISISNYLQKKRYLNPMADTLNLKAHLCGQMTHAIATVEVKEEQMLCDRVLVLPPYKLLLHSLPPCSPILLTLMLSSCLTCLGVL